MSFSSGKALCISSGEPRAGGSLSSAQPLVPFLSLRTHGCWLQTTCSRNSGQYSANPAPAVCTSYKDRDEQGCIKIHTECNHSLRIWQLIAIELLFHIPHHLLPCPLPLSSNSLSPLLSSSPLLVGLSIIGRNWGMFFQSHFHCRHIYTSVKYFHSEPMPRSFFIAILRTLWPIHWPST